MAKQRKKENTSEDLEIPMSSHAIRMAVIEISKQLCTRRPPTKGRSKSLRKKRNELLALLAVAEEGEGREDAERKRRWKEEKPVRDIMMEDMNPSRKAICRPGRGRRGGWLVQGGFMDGHGKVDGWKKDK
jgi:hypothetical protein